MKIEIQNQTDKSVDEPVLTDSIESVFAELQKRSVSLPEGREKLIVVIMDEAPAKALNQKFREKDAATDVLSFDPIEGDSLGELVLCADVVEKQAPEHGVSVSEEYVYLILHGILHLLGYEHENGGSEAERMYALQDEVFDVVR